MSSWLRPLRVVWEYWDSPARTCLRYRRQLVRTLTACLTFQGAMVLHKSRQRVPQVGGPTVDAANTVAADTLRSQYAMRRL